MVNGLSKAHSAPSRRFWAFLLISFGLGLGIATHLSEDAAARIIISAVITLGLAAVIIPFFLILDLHSGHLRIKPTENFAQVVPSIIFLLMIVLAAMLSTGVFGVGLTELTETSPKLGMHIMVISIPVALFVFASANGTRIKERTFVDNPITNKSDLFRKAIFMLINRKLLILLGLFGLFGGSILSISLFVPQLIFPIVMSVLGVVGIGYLVYMAIRSSNVLTKFGMYTVSVILFYELLILVERVLTYWSRTVVS